jgi:hypothetical protein
MADMTKLQEAGRLPGADDIPEISPAMLEAGTEVIAGYDDGFLTSDETWVKRIYFAMRMAYLEGLRTACDACSSD